ncbi:MAG: hypothetical protein LBN43_05620, partial [Oscillospiraceae bacterium]|nr:hypothetical protein [Oscillospiraceae bacterium]
LKVKWLAIAEFLFFLYEVIVLPMPLKFLPLVSILNLVLICGDLIAGQFRKIRKPNIRGARWKAQTQPRARPSTFTSDVGSGNSFTERKCSVCGKSAAEHPELEFRYCSRCSGMHCFCEEHINAHVHFGE